MAPEYAMHGYLTDKADVYSFGVVALEIVSGKSNTIHRSKQEALHLLDWVTYFLCLCGKKNMICSTCAVNVVSSKITLEI